MRKLLTIVSKPKTNYKLTLELMSTKLAIFDLDNTLIAGDSDHAWGEFLVKKGVVDKQYYSEKNQQFYDDYKNGCLDIYEFLAFSLKPLADNDYKTLISLRDEFMDTEIEPIMLPAAQKLVQSHTDQGHTVMIITATNTFVTSLIAKRLNIPHLLGTEPEWCNNAYTGKVSGTPCFQDGKIKRLNAWLKHHALELGYSWFYSDSHNDIPLLETVDEAIAVDPDDKLREHASQQNWQTISLRT